MAATVSTKGNTTTLGLARARVCGSSMGGATRSKIVEPKSSLAYLAAEIVSSYVESNALPRSELPELIGRVYGALAQAAGGGAELAPERAPPAPAVPIRKSVAQDHIVCLEDGLKFKSIKRHLASKHGLTPEQYRQRWGLARDYPITAPAYAEARSELAKRIGLGRKAASRRRARSRG